MVVVDVSAVRVTPVGGPVSSGTGKQAARKQRRIAVLPIVVPSVILETIQDLNVKTNKGEWPQRGVQRRTLGLALSGLALSHETPAYT